MVDLQSGDPHCMEVWTLLCDISRKEFQKVYDRLGVRLEEHGESFYNSMIPSAIDDLAAAGLVEKDDGADIVRLEHFTYPLIVRKRDGEHGGRGDRPLLLYFLLGSRFRGALCLSAAVMQRWCAFRFDST